MAMFANNLSTLGVSAAQLDNRFDTQSYSVAWLPTTGEFGLWNTFGDYDDHEKLATRLGAALHPQPRGQTKPARHRRHREQPDPPDRRQRRLHAGSVRARHHRQRSRLPDVERRRRSQVPGPVARGRVLLALVEQLHRHQHRAASAGINDHGYQLQTSAMVVPRFCSCTSAGRRCSAAMATSGRCAAAPTCTR